jgi:hypothetical protein
MSILPMRVRIRHWLQRRGYELCPIRLLWICDALIWLTKNRVEHGYDRRIADEASRMIFVDMALPNLKVVNDAGDSAPYRGVTWMTPGEEVKPLLNRRMPDGFHLEATSTAEKLPE